MRVNGHLLGESYYFWGQIYHFYGSIVTIVWPLYTLSNSPKNLGNARILTAPVPSTPPLKHLFIFVAKRENIYIGEMAAAKSEYGAIVKMVLRKIVI